MLKGLGLGLLASLVVAACATRRYSEAELGSVRLMTQLPRGISCEKVDEVRLRDGTGCGYMGSSRPAQSETLYYNLRQQARQRQANVVLLKGSPQPESWEGCPSNGLIAEASLYRCAFAQDTDLPGS